MNQHPYLRAYMAGIVVPTLFLLIALTAFTVGRYVYDLPLPIERIIVFPLTAVPNLWGLWNIIHVALPARWRIPIGVFGAVLPLLLAPAGWLVARAVGFPIPTHLLQAAPLFLPVGMLIYYLLWKHVVGRLNAVVDIG